MSQNTSKRACISCKDHKIKCSRVLPSCRECQKSGRECAYPTQSPVRFRDQTEAATTRAIQKWRARSTKQTSPPASSTTSSRDGSPKQVVLRAPPNPSVDYVARTRFLFDYTETPISPFTANLRCLILQWAANADTNGNAGPGEGFRSALDAVSLLSFSHRYKDQRARLFSVEKQHEALIKIRDRISNVTRVTTEDIFAVLLLGMYENFHQEGHAVGSWVHHFVGAVRMMLLRDDNAPEQDHFAHIVGIQALHNNIEWDTVAIVLPDRLSSWYTSEVNYIARAVNLAQKVLVFCDRHKDLLPLPNLDLSIPPESLIEVFELEQTLQNFESELKQEVPFQTSPISTEEYASWYRPVTTHVAAPILTHTYPGVWAALTWNNYRTVHVRLLAWILDTPSCATTLPEEMRSDLLESALQKINDMCDSVYSFLLQNENGRPLPTDCDSLPSTGPYCIHGLLSGVMKIIAKSPSLLAGAGEARVDWLARTLRMFTEYFAISTCRCFSTVDIDIRQSVFDRLKLDHMS